MKTKLTIIIFSLHFLCLEVFSQDTRIWGTYFGGMGNAWGYKVATDNNGNVYLVGRTTDTSNIAVGGFQNTFGGGFTDAFLAKFNSSGGLLWATYYGGTGIDAASAVTTDDLGNVYIAGPTTSTSGISFGGFQNSIAGIEYDAFLAKFDSSGNRIWATYYGGTGNEGSTLYNLATDPIGNIYMVGTTNSDSSIASGGYQNVIGGNFDAFLVKFDAFGNRIWSTYCGGWIGDIGYGVATDFSGNVYISGFTGNSTGIASGGFQNSMNGGADAFLIKMNSAGNLIWGTYYGGPGTEDGASVATDLDGNIYLSGSTSSDTLISSGGFQNTYGGGNCDAYLVKFDSSCNRIWATYYGGPNTDYGTGVKTNNDGNVFLTGSTDSPSAIANGGFQNILIDSVDAFLVKFDSFGNRFCSSYYGGPTLNYSWGIAVDTSDHIYMSGYTNSSTDIASTGYQNIYGGGINDAYLVKFSSCADPTSEIPFILANQEIIVYPNPATDKAILMFNNEMNKNCSLKIYNTHGQLIRFMTDITQNKIEIERNNIGNGIYFYILQNDKQIIATGKLIFD